MAGIPVDADGVPRLAVPLLLDRLDEAATLIGLDCVQLEALLITLLPEEFLAAPASAPTTHPACSAQKVLELMARAERGEALFHAGDSPEGPDTRRAHGVGRQQDSGHGVSAVRRKFRARFWWHGGRVDLGYFAAAQEAVEAVRRERLRLEEEERREKK